MNGDVQTVVGTIATTAMPPLPRPNPGPEAMPPPLEAWSLAAAWVALLLVLLVGLRQLKRSWRPGSSRGGTAAAGGMLVGPIPPGASLVELAERARAVVAARHGAAWSARTTEEIRGSEALRGQLGDVAFAELVELLKLADVAKFGGGPREAGPWRDWVERFRTETDRPGAA